MKTADAVKYFGSKGKVAKALGISRQALSMWGENVPKLRAWQLWYITDGKLELTDRERPAA